MTLSSKQQEVMNQLLVEAVKSYDLPRIQLYVSKGADIKLNLQNTQEVVRRNGSTYSSYGAMPLYHYMCQDYYRADISGYFLAQGVDIDVKSFSGATQLMQSVRNADSARVEYCLAKGADPLASDNGGAIVLEEARNLSSSSFSRQRIIDALVNAMENPAAKPAAAPEKKTAANAETGHDIQVLKPIELAPRKKGGGLHL